MKNTQSAHLKANSISLNTGRKTRRDRGIGWFAFVAVALTCATTASAQMQIQAKADVNGQAVVNVNRAAVPNATGSAIGAAKIFHPANGMAGSSYQVNGAAANAQTEAPILDTIADLAKPIADNAGNAIRQRPFINGTQNRIATCTVPDTVAGPGRPCRVVAGTGSFPLVNKANGISSDTGNVQRMVGGNNYEFASATASQTMVNNRFRVVGNPVTQVNAAQGMPAPVAVAYATNRDPMAVYWNSPSSRDFTLDLSRMSVGLFTQGPGSAASAYFSVNAGVIDGTTDISLPESSSAPIFSLLLPFNEINGQAPTINLAAFALVAAGSISDSLGDFGVVNVANGLLSDLTVVSGRIQFALPYSITVGLPGMNSQSVLFVDTQSFAESEATPEPSTLLLLGSGLVGLGGILRRRIRR